MASQEGSQCLQAGLMQACSCKGRGRTWQMHCNSHCKALVLARARSCCTIFCFGSSKMLKAAGPANRAACSWLAFPFFDFPCGRKRDSTGHGSDLAGHDQGMAALCTGWLERREHRAELCQGGILTLTPADCGAQIGCQNHMLGMWNFPGLKERQPGANLTSVNQLQKESQRQPAPPEFIHRDEEMGREGGRNAAQGKANDTNDHIPDHHTSQISQALFELSALNQQSENCWPPTYQGGKIMKVPKLPRETHIQV